MYDGSIVRININNTIKLYVREKDYNGCITWIAITKTFSPILEIRPNLSIKLLLKCVLHLWLLPKQAQAQDNLFDHLNILTL